MPELPEVETVVRGLRPHLEGRRIQGVHVGPKKLRQPWEQAWEEGLIGRRLEKLHRRGKYIFADLDDRTALVVHLGMTGRLFVTAATAAEEPHTHFAFPLQGRPAEELRFNDARRFGFLVRWSAERSAAFLAGEKLGPEPWDLTDADFFAALRGTSRCLKAALLDQAILAGVGNIYADEALFVAKLRPTVRGCDLSQAQCRKLKAAILAVLEKAIDHHGSTIRTFYYGEGDRGDFQNEFQVYDRGGQPCRRCRTAIERIRLAGRSTHFCAKCQK